MDKPAIVLSAIIGLVLIGVSLPFLILDEGDGQDQFEIMWTQAEAGRDEGALVMGSTQTFTVTVEAGLPSNATVEVTCTDGATPPLQPAATVTWELFEGDGTTPIDSGSGCAVDETVRLGGHPDVATAAADSAEDAEQVAMGDDLRTVTYRLEVTASRPAATGGLPVPPGAFSGTGRLVAEEWLATANPETEEGSR